MSSLRSLAELGEALAATKNKLEQRALIGAYLQALPRSLLRSAAQQILLSVWISPGASATR